VDRAEGAATTPCASTKSVAEMTEETCIMSKCSVDAEAGVKGCCPVMNGCCPVKYPGGCHEETRVRSRSSYKRHEGSGSIHIRQY
jgi:hypothetical protein